MLATSAVTSTDRSGLSHPVLEPRASTHLAERVLHTGSSSAELVKDFPANSRRPEHREHAEGGEDRVLGEAGDSDRAVQADRDLQASMLGQLESRRNIPLPVPRGSLIDEPVDLYKQTLNDPKVLAWLESKALALDSLIIREHSISGNVTGSDVSSTETFTVSDASGWWQVSAQVLAARQVLDPGDFGLPYVDDRKLIPCNVIIDFYGVVPPTSDEEVDALANRLKREGWPEITPGEKVELDNECHTVKALIREAKVRTQLINTLENVVKDSENAQNFPLSFDLQQKLSFSGFGNPKNTGEVCNIIRWLQTSLPKATPLGDYGAELLWDSQSPVRLTAAERATVIKLANEVSNGASSIIDELGADLLLNTSDEYRRSNADELLNDMFEKDQFVALGHQLLQALDWYGACQTASPENYETLLLAAIKLEVDPDFSAKSGIIAGYDVYQPKNLGRDLTVVRTEIEQHLIEHKGVSAQAAPLIAHLFLADVAPEFLAQDLSEGIQVGTGAWMALSLGGAIAEVLDPGCSRIMTTDQLMTLALLEPTTPEQELLFKNLAADISILWAVMNGVIQRHEDSSYSSEDYKTAAQMFATQRDDLSNALEGFKRELHTRRELAAKELRIAFPITLKRLTESEARMQPPTERKQLPMEEIIIGPRQIEEFDTRYKGKTKLIVEAYMDKEGSPRSWEMCDVQMPDQQFDDGWSKLPDLDKIFSASVDSFFDARKQSFVTATKSLIATLPLEDRQSLEFGEVRFFTLREETGMPKEDETPSNRAKFQGRQGTLLRCEVRDGEENKVSYFEVFPGRMSIIKRTDLPHELPLDGVKKIEQVRLKGTVNVDVQRGTELPFDFAAYAKGSEPIAGAKSQKLIIEKLGGSLPARAEQEGRASVPNSYFSERTSDIVDRIVNDNLLQGERDFLFEKAKGTTSEEDNRAYREKVTNFLLQLIPFVGCTQDLRSGDRMRFINGAFGCFTDLVSILNTVAGGVGKLSNALKSVAPIRAKAFEVLRLAGQTTVSLVNPLDGVSGVAAGGARTLGGFARLFKSGAFAFTKTGIGHLQTSVDRLRGYFGGFASGAAGTALPNRMNTFAHRVTGTVDGTDITAIRDNGKWYALDKNGNPIGRALDNFIVLTA